MMRVLRFLGGVAVGFIGLLALVLGVFFVGDRLEILKHDHRPALEKAVLTGRGADISRHGGVDVVVEEPGFVMRQRCRGPCDDVSPSPAGWAVRVLDASGRCVVCRRRLFAAPLWKSEPWWIGETARAAGRRVGP